MKAEAGNERVERCSRCSDPRIGRPRRGSDGWGRFQGKISKESLGLLAVFLGAVAIFGGILIAVAVYDRASQRRYADVEPSESPAEKDDLPKASFIRFGGVKWIDDDHSSWGEESSAMGAWGARRGYDALIQYVLKFPAEPMARHELRVAPYGRIYDDEDYLVNLRPFDLNGEGLRAESASLGCLSRPDEREPTSSIWIFHGRYGKYLIEIAFDGRRDSSLKRHLEKDTFLQMVKAVDRRAAALNIGWREGNGGRRSRVPSRIHVGTRRRAHDASCARSRAITGATCGRAKRRAHP